MEGITILSTNSEMIWTNSTFITMIILLGITFIIAIIAKIFEDNAPIWFTISAIVLAIILLISTICIMICGPKEPRITHKVLIDESVSMIEFNEKYKITNQDGKIYTVIEKDFSK